MLPPGPRCSEAMRPATWTACADQSTLVSHAARVNGHAALMPNRKSWAAHAGQDRKACAPNGGGVSQSR